MARIVKRPAGTLEERCAAQAAAKREEARRVADRVERERLLREARQLETAAKMEGWLLSPELKPPS